MSGMTDGVNDLWILRYRHRALDVSGYLGEVSALDHLIRCARVKGIEKDVIRRAVEHALTHMDDLPEGSDEDD